MPWQAIFQPSITESLIFPDDLIYKLHLSEEIVSQEQNIYLTLFISALIFQILLCDTEPVSKLICQKTVGKNEQANKQTSKQKKKVFSKHFLKLF